MSWLSFAGGRVGIKESPRWVVAGGVLFRLALSWLVLVTSGRLEASDGASIHRCQPGNVGFPRSIRWLASIATHLVT